MELEVADTGSGIEQSVMERMFDPFFTTKEVGQGSGMGLAMVHGIVHDHGGHVFVSSAPGAGTSFRILLPAVDASLPSSAGTSKAARPARRKLQGRLLLVEDQAMVADYMKELLQSWGLEVTVHGHPAEAHLWYLRDPRQVDLVITDQTMPSMTGVQLAAFMTSVRPDLPVLIYTGYGEGLAESDLRGAGVVALAHQAHRPRRAEVPSGAAAATGTGVYDVADPRVFVRVRDPAGAVIPFVIAPRRCRGLPRGDASAEARHGLRSARCSSGPSHARSLAGPCTVAVNEGRAEARAWWHSSCVPCGFHNGNLVRRDRDREEPMTEKPGRARRNPGPSLTRLAWH